jgi:hypothetical protein
MSTPQISTCPALGEVAGDHLHRGGLAGAVGSQEAEDLAAGEREIDFVDRDALAELAGERRGTHGQVFVRCSHAGQRFLGSEGGGDARARRRGIDDKRTANGLRPTVRSVFDRPETWTHARWRLFPGRGARLQFRDELQRRPPCDGGQIYLNWLET